MHVEGPTGVPDPRPAELETLLHEATERLTSLVEPTLAGAAGATSDGHLLTVNIALAALGAIAAAVAHEVNSPLAGVLANLAYVIEALPAAGLRDTAAGREIAAALEDARAGAEHLREVVRDLRRFAGTAAGERRPGDVAALEATPGVPRAPAPPRAHAAARRRVLVVDDEPAVGRSLRRLLPEHDLALARSGAEALAALAADPDVDVILCDVTMPGMSGVELHRALTARQPALAARVVFMTGGAVTSEVAALARLSGASVLEKPFDLDRLRAAVSGRRAPGG